MSTTVIYKNTYKSASQVNDGELAGYTVKIWQPDFKHFVPPGKSGKYVLYWLFDFLRVFKNQYYRAIFVYKSNEVVCSLLVVPTHYKWPFMNNNDVQFTYVMTNSKFRGQGIAAIAINYAMNEMHKKGVKNFWYVTNSDNTASIKLCTKIGFKFYSNAIQKSLKILQPVNA